MFRKPQQQHNQQRKSQGFISNFGQQTPQTQFSSSPRQPVQRVQPQVKQQGVQLPQGQLNQVQLNQQTPTSSPQESPFPVQRQPQSQLQGVKLPPAQVNPVSLNQVAPTSSPQQSPISVQRQQGFLNQPISQPLSNQILRGTVQTQPQFGRPLSTQQQQPLLPILSGQHQFNPFSGQQNLQSGQPPVRQNQQVFPQRPDQFQVRIPGPLGGAVSPLQQAGRPLPFSQLAPNSQLAKRQ